MSSETCFAFIKAEAIVSGADGGLSIRGRYTILGFCLLHFMALLTTYLRVIVHEFLTIVFWNYVLEFTSWCSLSWSVRFGTGVWDIAGFFWYSRNGSAPTSSSSMGHWRSAFWSRAMLARSSPPVLSSSLLHDCCIIIIANEWVDNLPWGHEMPASKLSAITWTKPWSALVILCSFGSFGAVTAADFLKRRTSL